jgi:hypothetical protein
LRISPENSLLKYTQKALIEGPKNVFLLFNSFGGTFSIFQSLFFKITSQMMGFKTIMPKTKLILSSTLCHIMKITDSS